jgi:superfamily II DNA/RNA helicase
MQSCFAGHVQKQKRLLKKLSAEGYNSDALHGDLSQQQREYTMSRFRNRSLQLLIATDVAARGLDVTDLTHVINYNLPDDPDVYIHRSGRTGRAHRKGISISIIHSREHNRIKDLERRVGKPFERKKVPTGKEICEKQLFHLVDKVENVEVEEERIKEFLPVIFNKISWLDREELIKRFVSVEFNRFLEYYKDSKDINIDHTKPERRKTEYQKPDYKRRDERQGAGSREHREGRNERVDRKGDRQEKWKSPARERHSYSAEAPGDLGSKGKFETRDRTRKSDFDKDKKQGEWSREPDVRKRDRFEDKPAPAKRGDDRPKVKFAPLVINLGTVNKFNPKTLLSLINQYMPDQETQVGKIEVSYAHTVFDVDAENREQVMNAFRKAQFRGTKVIVDQPGKKKDKKG